MRSDLESRIHISSSFNKETDNIGISFECRLGQRGFTALILVFTSAPASSRALTISIFPSHAAFISAVFPMLLMGIRVCAAGQDLFHNFALSFTNSEH